MHALRETRNGAAEKTSKCEAPRRADGPTYVEPEMLYACSACVVCLSERPQYARVVGVAGAGPVQ